MIIKNYTKACAIACSLTLALGLSACGGTSKQATEAPAEQTTQETTATETPEVTAEGTATETAPAAVEKQPAAAATTTDAVSTISPEDAKAIALADAGADEAATTELTVEHDLDDVVAHYEVEFKFNGLEYDYDIDSTTGAIIKVQSEIDD